MSCCFPPLCMNQPSAFSLLTPGLFEAHTLPARTEQGQGAKSGWLPPPPSDLWDWDSEEVSCFLINSSFKVVLIIKCHWNYQHFLPANCSYYLLTLEISTQQEHIFLSSQLGSLFLLSLHQIIILWLQTDCYQPSEALKIIQYGSWHSQADWEMPPTQFATHFLHSKQEDLFYRCFGVNSAVKSGTEQTH